MSSVYFASVKMKEFRGDASLPAKFIRMLHKFRLKEMFDGKRVAIKMHLGGHIGYTTIPPLFVKLLAKEIKDAGGTPFVTDGVGAVPGADPIGGVLEDPLGDRLGDAELDLAAVLLRGEHLHIDRLDVVGMDRAGRVAADPQRRLGLPCRLASRDPRNIRGR